MSSGRSIPSLLPFFMRFITAHSSHTHWTAALEQALAQVARARAQPDTIARPNLGIVYVTEAFAPAAEALLAALRSRTGVAHWVGGVGVGIAADGQEYVDQPALALMLLQIPLRDFRVFSGLKPLAPASTGWRGAETALVHGDPATPDMDDLVRDMAGHTASNRIWGGLVSSRQATVQIADGVFRGGLSGVAFSSRVALAGGLTQGCEPVGPARAITRCTQNVIYALDGEPALGLLLQDLGEQALELPRLAPRLRATLAGLSPGVAEANLMARHIGAETSMRHLIGVDPSGHGVAIAGSPEPGMQLRFCRRDVDAARRDLVRLCAEVREELEQRREARMASMLPHAAANVGAPQRSLPARGAVYISCTGRGGAHFGGPSAELALVRQHLGDLPLIGFFAAGEIAGDRLYGYTGVLTVFSENPAM